MPHRELKLPSNKKRHEDSTVPKAIAAINRSGSLTLLRNLEHTKEDVFLAYITVSTIHFWVKAEADKVRSRSPTCRDEDNIMIFIPVQMAKVCSRPDCCVGSGISPLRSLQGTSPSTAVLAPRADEAAALWHSCCKLSFGSMHSNDRGMGVTWFFLWDVRVAPMLRTLMKVGDVTLKKEQMHQWSREQSCLCTAHLLSRVQALSSQLEKNWVHCYMVHD